MPSTHPERRRSVSLWTVICIVLAAVLAGFWFSYLRPTGMGGPATYIIVSGPSMEPTLKTGDLAFVLERSSYEVGDIVAVRVRNSYAIHRIVDTEGQTFITQGDNSPAPDSWRAVEADIAGAMQTHIPSIGGMIQGKYWPVFMGIVVGLVTTAIIFSTPLGRSPAKPQTAFVDDEEEWEYWLEQGEQEQPRLTDDQEDDDRRTG